MKNRISSLKIIVLLMAGVICLLSAMFCMQGCTNKSATGDAQALAASESWPQQNLEAGYVDVPDGRVIYRLYGKDKLGTPIIFLHGGPGGNCDSMWKQYCLASDRPVLFYNQLGSSNSHYNDSIDTAQKAKDTMSIDHYCTELDTVIKHFGYNEFILGGASWGTMLAVEYASKYNPSGLKAMILAGPFLNVERWTADAERLIKSLDGGESMWNTIQKCIATKDYYNPEYLKINEIYTEHFNCCNNEAKQNCPTEETYEPFGIENSPYYYMWGPSEFTCTGILKGHDSTQLLKSINVPILYISGEHDSGTPQAAFEYCNKTNKGEVCVLPSCAHKSYMERPEEFSTVVTKFIERL